MPADITQRSGRTTPTVRKVRRKYKKPIGPPAPGRSRPGPFVPSVKRSVTKASKQVTRGTRKPGPGPKRPLRQSKRQRRVLRRARAQRDARQTLAFLRRSRDDDSFLENAYEFAKSGGGLGLAAREARKVSFDDIRSELEGTGRLAGLGAGAKKALDRATVVESSPTLPIGASSRKPIAGKYGESSAKVFVNLLKDAIDIPANVPASVYAVGAAALEAGAKGDTSRAKRLWNDFKNHDAIALGVQGRWKEAVKSAEQHPGVLALELSGAKAAVARTPTRAHPTVTRREPKRLEGTNLEQPRRYSPDAVTRARQKTVEGRQRRKVRRMRDEAQRQEARGGHDRAYELREKAAKRDPDRVSRQEIERRVDERVQANEDIRRINRAEVTEKARKTVVKKGGAAQSLLAQNIIRADRADLAKYLNELKAAHDGLGQAGRVANRALQAEIRKALNNKKLDLKKVDEAAAAYRDVVAPLEKKLTDIGALDRVQADRAKLIPYAVREMGARHDGQRLTLRGKPLSTAAIRAHMAERGVKEPAFVTQAPNMRGGKNFFISSHEPKKLAQGRRTGEATRKGTFDAHPDTLVEGAARMQGIVDANDGFRGFVAEVGRREGKALKTYPNRKDALDAANNLNAEPGSIGWQPVRINPLGGKKAMLDDLIEKVDAEHQLEAKPLLDALDDAAAGADGPGPWALVPEAAAQRMRAHIRVLGTGAGGKTAQLVNSAFRKTVLATSTKWATGNVLEAAMRSAVMRAGPRSYMTGRKVRAKLKETDPDLAKQFDVRVAGGGHYAMAERAHTRRSAEQFFGSRLDKPARALGAFWRTPGPKYAAAAWRGWTSFVFDTTRRVEAQFQTAMAGKAVRDTLLDDKMMKLSDRAIEQAINGKIDLNTIVDLGRRVDRGYGRYSKWSPTKRQAIALYTPFVAWSLNAVRFVYDVLPRDHPVVTGLLASAHIATEEWRKEHGLGKFIDGAVPDWLQGSLPLDDGGHLRVGRYLPFGFFSDPGGTIAGNVLPQYSGPLMALRGLDWKGDKIGGGYGHEPNDLEKSVIAAHEFLKATIPVLGQTERIVGNEGSFGQKFKKELNPFEAIAPPGEKKSGGGYFDDSDDDSSKGGYFDDGEKKKSTGYFD